MARLSQGGSLKKPTKPHKTRHCHRPLLHILGRLKLAGLWTIRSYEHDGRFERLELHEMKNSETQELVEDDIEHGLEKDDQLADQEDPRATPRQDEFGSDPRSFHQGDTGELGQRFIDTLAAISSDSSQSAEQRIETQAPENVEQREKEEDFEVEPEQAGEARVATPDTGEGSVDAEMSQMLRNIAAYKAEREGKQQAAVAAGQGVVREGCVGPEELWEDDDEGEFDEY